jgi:hypothetical protein
MKILIPSVFGALKMERQCRRQGGLPLFAQGCRLRLALHSSTRGLPQTGSGLPGADFPFTDYFEGGVSTT